MQKGTLRKFLVIGLVSVIALGGLAFLLRETIMDRVNRVRAERMYAQAVAAFEEESWDRAARLGTAAYYLAPKNEDIQLVIARSLFKQRSPGAVGWWLEALDHPDIPVDELRELTSILLNARKMEEGMVFLNRLVQLDANNPETRRLWLRSLEQQRRLAGVMELSGRLVEQGSEDWTVHQQYLVLQRAMGGEAGEQRVAEHLEELIESDSSLSLMAARELASRGAISEEQRLLAARYLLENAEDDLDRLYAASLEVRAGIRDNAELLPIIERIAAEGSAAALRDLMRWSIWMDQPARATQVLDWATYRERGGEAEPYFEALLAQGAYRELVQISEREFARSGPEAPLFMYYRAKGYERLGEATQAERALDFAIEVVDPERSQELERRLFLDQRWNLLRELYQALLANDPGNIVFLQKHLSACYHLGDQDELIATLERVDVEDFSGQPAIMGFILYMRILVFGAQPDDHNRLERLLAQYPEIFDFRLVLGFSFLLQGDLPLAHGFLEGMPELTLRAPRFLRICAVILGHSTENLIAPGEREYLLPREKLLISRFAPGPATD
jgi:thioredoxin-like negative regulator of GroEL